MSQTRTSMNKIKEIIRLRFGLKYSYGRIASICGLGKGTVISYAKKAEQHQISWPLPEEMSEETLTALLFGRAAGDFVEPDYEKLHDELSRKGVTLTLLWQEYSQEHGERAYKYGRLCKGYREWSD